METTAGGGCPSCGALLPADARWCGRCGAHRSADASHPHQPASDPDHNAHPDLNAHPDHDADPPGTTTTLETPPRDHTPATERFTWFAGGLLTAGAIALAVSLIGSPAAPPVAEGSGGEGAESNPAPEDDELPTGSSPEPDVNDREAPTDTDDDRDQDRRDSLATCRTVDGDACGPTFDLDGTATSDVGIVDDHLLALDRDGRIRSLSVATGQQRWQRSSGMDSPEVNLTVAQDHERFVVWSPTLVQARDLDNGEVHWETFYADVARTGDVRPFGSVHLLDDAVVLLGSRTVTVLDAATGSTNHQVMIGDGQVRLLPDGFAIVEDDQVRRWDTIEPTPRWQETFADEGALRFVDQPAAGRAEISGAPLAIAGSATGDILVLDPEDGDRLLELPGSQHHDLQRLEELLISVTWPDPDSAMARVVGTRSGEITDAVQVSIPCCGASILAGPDDFVAVAAPRVGSHAVLIDVDRSVRLDLVRPDEIVGQRTPTALTETLAMWRSPTGQVGADQLTGRIHWRASTSATPISIQPLILAGERSIVWVTAPTGAEG